MFVRGSTVVFTVTFKDEEGNEVLASNAYVRVAYRKNREILYETANLSQVGETNSYSASWNSSNAEPGEIFWHARGEGDLGTIAGENSFVLVGNRANPEV